MMGQDNAEYSSAGVAHHRLNDLLDKLSVRGLTQNQIAAKASLPVQYLSDIKRNRRPLTELVARRIGEEFDVNFEWLMGTSNVMQNPKPGLAATNSGSSLWLPMFCDPIEGEPRAHPKWDGTGIEIAGVAAAKAMLAQHPYLLRFGGDDEDGRVHRGDLILVFQDHNIHAEISVVRQSNKKLFLARPNQDGTWTRLVKGLKLPRDSETAGHCVGIVWSTLCH